MNSIKLLAAAMLAAAHFISFTHTSAAQEQAPQTQATKSLKHKIAVGRFSNETRYGQSLLREGGVDPLAKQAADILTAYLVQTGRFMLFERPDIDAIEKEQARVGGQTVGVDALIVGSVVEFGRTEDGKRGLFNKERTQRAYAKVAIRLVDVRTGLAFHSVTGQGEATTETKTILGMGSTSKFDATLTDKALSVAVEDMLEELVNTLSNRPWKTDILAAEGGQIFIAGGQRQGLKVGDTLKVMKPGKTVKSSQTGFDIQLPAAEVGTLKVVSFFGESETNEGAVTQPISGTLTGIDTSSLIVVAE